MKKKMKKTKQKKFMGKNIVADDRIASFLPSEELNPENNLDELL